MQVQAKGEPLLQSVPRVAWIVARVKVRVKREQLRIVLVSSGWPSRILSCLRLRSVV